MYLLLFSLHQSLFIFFANASASFWLPLLLDKISLYLIKSSDFWISSKLTSGDILIIISSLVLSMIILLRYKSHVNFYLTQIFNNHCAGAAAAVTNSGNAIFPVVLLQHVKQSYNDPCAGCPKRVAQRNRASVHIHPGRIEF